MEAETENEDVVKKGRTGGGEVKGCKGTEDEEEGKEDPAKERRRQLRNTEEGMKGKKEKS
ncbi:hypothetical protein EYF80_045093 [Liparis tanakae]|uniref:Uncharacterized protein n=1 Tax=Liparis tanakae TaxID=230148 RepID=A0A4Z2FUM0_9TELE|nr:hypothetical protein EYF80_045093 [Liparis tanakae]